MKEKAIVIVIVVVVAIMLISTIKSTAPQAKEAMQNNCITRSVDTLRNNCK